MTQKKPITRRRFTDKMKRLMVTETLDKGVRATSEKYHVSNGLLYRWRAEFAPHGTVAAPGEQEKPEPASKHAVNGTFQNLRVEIAELREQNTQLKTKLIELLIKHNEI